MKFKKNTKIETDDLWYDLIENDRIDTNKILDSTDAIRVKEAIETLRDFKKSAENQDVIKYY